MDELNLATAQNLVDEIIAEYGEGYVYLPVNGGDCQYVAWGQPSCIVGHVLSRFGVDITSWEGRNENTDNISHLYDDGKVNLTRQARTFLGSLQAHQDEGHPWGMARERALKFLDGF